MTTKATTTVVNLSNPTITGTVTATTFSGSGSSLTNVVKTINSTSGDITLSSLDDFAKSYGASGYQKVPGGFIIQWGTSNTLNNGGTQAITFPIAFPTALRQVQRSQNRSTGYTGGSESYITTSSTTGFTLAHRGFDTYTGSMSYFWLAVGN